VWGKRYGGKTGVGIYGCGGKMCFEKDACRERWVWGKMVVGIDGCGERGVGERRVLG